MNTKSMINTYLAIASIAIHLVSASTATVTEFSAWQSLRPCAQGCFNLGIVDYDMLALAIGCDTQPTENECMCRGDLQGSAHAWLSSCVNSECSQNSVDVASATSCYDGYCTSNGFTSEVQVQSTPTTNAGQTATAAIDYLSSILGTIPTSNDYLSIYESVLTAVPTSNDYLSIYESAISAILTTDDSLSSMLYPTSTDTVTDPMDAVQDNSSGKSNGGGILSNKTIIGLAVGITGAIILGITMWLFVRHKKNANATKYDNLIASKKPYLTHSSDPSVSSQSSRQYGPVEAGGHTRIHQGDVQVINNYGHNAGVVRW